jgi:hypothetical protein
LEENNTRHTAPDMAADRAQSATHWAHRASSARMLLRYASIESPPVVGRWPPLAAGVVPLSNAEVRRRRLPPSESGETDTWVQGSVWCKALDEWKQASIAATHTQTHLQHHCRYLKGAQQWSWQRGMQHTQIKGTPTTRILTPLYGKKPTKPPLLPLNPHHLAHPSTHPPTLRTRASPRDEDMGDMSP